MVTDYTDLIAQVAKDREVSEPLVRAIVYVESGGNTDAFRYEPAFYQHYLKDKPEWAGQIPRRISASYGLMQILYVTAKELGMDGDPELLFVPHIGLFWGCVQLKKLLDWAGNTQKALAAYNAGQGAWNSPAGHAYAAKVLAALKAKV